MGFNKTVLAILGLSALLAGIAGHEAGYAQSVSVAPSPKQESKSESSAAAAMPASTQSSVQTIKVTSRETVVDVTVTDKDGKPVRRVTGKAIPVEECARRAGDPAVLVAGSEKIKQELGWRPKFAELDMIVASAWEWQQKRYG